MILPPLSCSKLAQKLQINKKKIVLKVYLIKTRIFYEMISRLVNWNEWESGKLRGKLNSLFKR